MADPRRVFFTALAMMLLSNGAGSAPSLGEYQVKAVFLFNFTQFVAWPPETFVDSEAPFVIGVLGPDPFGSALDEAVRGETVNGHPLVVQRYRLVGDVRPCQILFISRAANSEVVRAPQVLARMGTLTVSDAEGSPLPREVVIQFRTENKKVRLRINVDSARGAGLTISSKLLRAAQLVENQGTG